MNTKIDKNDNLINMIFKFFFYRSSYVTNYGHLMPSFRKFTMQVGTGEKGVLPLHPHCEMIQKSFWHIPITPQVHIKSLEAGSRKIFLLKYRAAPRGTGLQVKRIGWKAAVGPRFKLRWQDWADSSRHWRALWIRTNFTIFIQF